MKYSNNDIGKVALKLRESTKLPAVQRIMNEGADLIEGLYKELRLCRNELCLHCGEYITAHEGSCRGCRWEMRE